MPRITNLATAFGAACPDFTAVNGIVLASRGLSRAAVRTETLPTWRDEMQPGLPWNIECGERLTP